MVEGHLLIESILEVDGVDAAFIGPYDLSASMGKPGTIADPHTGKKESIWITQMVFTGTLKYDKRSKMTEVKIKEKNGEHPLGDAGQLMFFGLFLIIWILDSFILHQSTFLAETIPLELRLMILGLALVAAAYLFKSGHVVVSGEQRPTEVVASGAFRYVRHPLYLGSIVVYLGLTVSTASLFCLALLVVIVLFYDYIAGYEEKLLEAKFGQAYIAYEKNTGKWVPGISKKR